MSFIFYTLKSYYSARLDFPWFFPEFVRKTRRHNARNEMTTTDDADAPTSPTATNKRALFGGAIACEIPRRFLDVSNSVPVEDNQEVFADGALDESVVIEIVESIERRRRDGTDNKNADDDEDDDAATARFAFEDMCEETAATWRRCVRADATRGRFAPNGPSGAPGVTARVYGVMRAAKSRAMVENELDVWGAVVRFPEVGADVLVWHLRPFSFGASGGSGVSPGGETALPSDEDAVRSGAMDSSVILGNILATFEVRDWGLFAGEG